MAAALAVSLTMIGGLLVLIVVRGGATFWVAPLDLVQFPDSDRALLGVREAEAGEGANASVRYRVANRDIEPQTAVWFPRGEVERSAITRPQDAAIIERDEWGDFFGFVDAVQVGGRTVASSGDAAWPDLLSRALAAGRARRAKIEHLSGAKIPKLEQRVREIGWERRRLARRAADHETNTAWLPRWAWFATLLGAPALFWTGRAVARRTPSGGGAVAPRGLAWALIAAGVVCVALVVLEWPWSNRPVSEATLAATTESLDVREAALRSDVDDLLAELDVLRAEDEQHRIVVYNAAGDRIAPRSQRTPQDPMLVSQATRVVFPNRLSFMERVGVYLDGWRRYLTREPRSNGAEGGVWPVIVGTVTLTLLLTVCVLPLGVIAAIYLREYARQGPVTSLIRIAINNLAGVPSIVYGMFGLGFFCYSLGGWIDRGPTVAAPHGRWWWGFVATTALVVMGGVLTAASARASAAVPKARHRAARAGAMVAWFLALAFAGWLVATTPYFSGFFAEKLPEQPTFGGRGILWASLTLALLTLPVVIVATEEAISAVPASMRQGSLATGASQWQTIRRIVLPHAMPGVMTGAILAMARGAGEVAPLMLVGAVNYSPTLPVSTDAPFLHGDRTFMHLGFHIYSVAFQSPDAEAAEPLVWTATLLLVSIVVILNIAAIWIRARLSRAHAGGGL